MDPWEWDKVATFGPVTVNLPGGGTTTDRLKPVPVSGGLSFASVSTGEFHTCGVTINGDAYCWGYNGFGQLGDGTNADATTPVRVLDPL